MGLTLFFLIAGVMLLYFGAEFLVRGSANLALRSGVSALTVGLTIVAFGTSTPELVVSVKAGFDGLGDIAIGNIVGSNIFNIAIILGISALVRPLKVSVQVLRIDTPIMVGVSLLFLILLLDSAITRVEGVFLFCGIIAYTGGSIYSGKKCVHGLAVSQTTEAPVQPKGTVPFDLFLIISGLGILVFGSRLFVKGAIDLAKLLHISEAVIGLTIVAAGTSLPELATSSVAAIRKEVDIALGNIVGSNIFNILAILGISGILTPLKAKGVGIVDLVFMVGTAACLLPFMRTGFRLSRIEGIALMGVYGGYLVYLWPK
ncbi:MAG: calcium/sodium antiporter [Chitinispirillaceae bacterium]|nr:calcium/sodium antiporter [Chitinispirillaceae bacterium]